MNQQIKEEWALNLENGDLKQAQGALQKNGSFCCLGVLCEMAVVEGVVTAETPNGGCYRTRYRSTHQEYDSHVGWLPNAVMKWAGLTHISPSVDGFELANLNDDGKSFPEIAKLIRKHL